MTYKRSIVIHVYLYLYTIRIVVFDTVFILNFLRLNPKKEKHAMPSFPRKKNVPFVYAIICFLGSYFVNVFISIVSNTSSISVDFRVV